MCVYIAGLMRNILYPAGKATYIDKREPIVEQGLSSGQNEEVYAEKLLVHTIITTSKKKQLIYIKLARHNKQTWKRKRNYWVI